MCVTPAKEKLERDDQFDRRVSRDVCAFRNATTHRLVDGVAFVSVQEELITNDVPVVRDCFVRQTIHEKLNFIKEGTTNELRVRIAIREGWQCTLEVHV